MNSLEFEGAIRYVDYSYNRQAVFKEEAGQVVVSFMNKSQNKEIGKLRGSDILVDVESDASKKVNETFLCIPNNPPRALSSFSFKKQTEIVKTIKSDYTDNRISTVCYRWLQVDTKAPVLENNETITGLLITDLRSYERHDYFDKAESLEETPPIETPASKVRIKRINYDKDRVVEFFLNEGVSVSAEFTRTSPPAGGIGSLNARQIEVDVDSAAAKTNYAFLCMEGRPSKELSSFSPEIQQHIVFSIDEKNKGDRWVVVSEINTKVTALLIIDKRVHEKH